MTQPSDCPTALCDTVEGARLREPTGAWRRWGPYPSDRQWGTVREDYSAHGTAWDYFPHDHARSRAYRWGEDAIGGFGHEKLHWCLGLALWNGQDPILKERLFGLTNDEGNHGEDVKELYFHQDALPSHAYLRMLYKYPFAAFPYDDLVAENRRRGQDVREYELLDTGVFAHGYADVTIEYAKAAPDDVLMRVTVVNRGDGPAVLHVLPQIWARNSWSWTEGTPRPVLRRDGEQLRAEHPALPPMSVRVSAGGEWLFCENDTNVARLYGVAAPGPFKDGIDACVVRGERGAVSTECGSKAASHAVISLAPGEARVLRLRLRPAEADLDVREPEEQAFDAIVAERQREADEFYGVLQAGIPDADSRLVQRQALAGMIWSKQYYNYSVRRWLDGDPAQPTPPAERLRGRNADWRHLENDDIVSMPDKWEYPWYASWDLAFHAVTFAMIDPAFAKAQLLLLVRDRYMHPNGRIPAYEWKFGDANPPVHAWAAWRVYQMDKEATGRADHEFLARVFHKLLLNFGWWVNRTDAEGRNLFSGGFLGLDNIEIFDRSAPLPTGGSLDQADGTAWMAAYALNLMRIALELARTDHAYEDIAIKFFEHFLLIAEAASHAGKSETGLWDDADGFFYDVLNLPDGQAVPLRVRSVVGLIPLFAVHVLDASVMREMPIFAARVESFLAQRPDLAGLVTRWHERGENDARLLALLRRQRTGRILARMLDEAEFLSGHGVRAVSRAHGEDPYVFRHNGESFSVRYLPAESDTRVFGGNSNWRGPIWMPINYLLVESLYEFHRFYGDSFTVEFPTGSGRHLTLHGVASELARRLAALSLRDAEGVRPVMRTYPQMAGQAGADELVLFHEYYDGETGRGVGASHQTGWSGLVALLLQPRREGAEASVPEVKA